MKGSPYWCHFLFVLSQIEFDVFSCFWTSDSVFEQPKNGWRIFLICFLVSFFNLLKITLFIFSGSTIPMPFLVGIVSNWIQLNNFIVQNWLLIKTLESLFVVCWSLVGVDLASSIFSLGDWKFFQSCTYMSRTPHHIVSLIGDVFFWQILVGIVVVKCSVSSSDLIWLSALWCDVIIYLNFFRHPTTLLASEKWS